MKIRAANKADVMNLAALSIQVWLHTYATNGIRRELSKFVFETFTEQYFKNALINPKHHILVSLHKDHLVGYVKVNLDSIWQDKSHGYEIDKLYVQEHFQGRGIGRQLLSDIAAHCGGTHWLSTWVHNEKAIDFYKHLGFRDIGFRSFQLGGELHENRILAFKPKYLALPEGM